MHAMRSVLLQLSGLSGILMFLVKMFNYASLEESLFTGAVVGVGTYLILLLVDISIQRILTAQPPKETAASSASGTSSEEPPSDQPEQQAAAAEEPAQETVAP